MTKTNDLSELVNAAKQLKPALTFPVKAITGRTHNITVNLTMSSLTKGAAKANVDIIKSVINDTWKEDISTAFILSVLEYATEKELQQCGIPFDDFLDSIDIPTLLEKIEGVIELLSDFSSIGSPTTQPLSLSGSPETMEV